MNRLNVRAFLLVLAGVILGSTGFASAQIVALGHSAARGYVAMDEMWSSVLESMLRARGSQVHVMNSGVNGETTAQELARVDSSVPGDTKIVILAISGSNDAKPFNVSADSSASAHANIAAIKSRITARGIKIIDAIRLYGMLMKQPAMAATDGRHLNAEGNKRLATILLPQVVAALGGMRTARQ